MKKLIIIVLVLTLASCGSTYNLSTDYRIKSILTITEKGDTLAVPVRDFKFRILDSRIHIRFYFTVIHLDINIDKIGNVGILILFQTFITDLILINQTLM